jgi:hypothetical protein
MKNRLLGLKPKNERDLTPDAVPTLNLPQTVTTGIKRKFNNSLQNNRFEVRARKVLARENSPT